MNTLAQLQTDFRRYVLHGEQPIQSQVVGTERVNATTRLAIYGNAYRTRLIEALDANYPALHGWLGDDEFNLLARAYIDACPSRHYSIRWFGHRLPEFLSNRAPWRDDTFSNEIARFEWAMSEAFDAADAPPVTADDMVQLAPETWPSLQLTFHASLRRLELQWNVAPIWRALTRDEKPDAAHDARKPVAWLVWRQQLTLFYRSLEADEAWALDAARGGANFAGICEGLCEWNQPDSVALRAAGFLRQWIADGLIVQLRS